MFHFIAYTTRSHFIHEISSPNHKLEKKNSTDIDNQIIFILSNIKVRTNETRARVIEFWAKSTMHQCSSTYIYLRLN
jgi:hypothetical protein